MHVQQMFAESKTGIPGVWECAGMDESLKKKFSFVVCDADGFPKPYLAIGNQNGRESYKELLIPVDPGDWVINAIRYDQTDKSILYIFVQKIIAVQPLISSVHFCFENLRWDIEPPSFLKQAIETAARKANHPEQKNTFSVQPVKKKRKKKTS